MITATAPAKLILCGEHAVVYGRPAIAIPLADVRAHAAVVAGEPGSGIRFAAPDIQRHWSVAEAYDDPLSELALVTLQQLAVGPCDLQVTLTSTIPIASGMGSGAAIATALVRALATFADVPLASSVVSDLVYTCEQRYHGTPSGIDNTVVAYEQPVWFQRQSPVATIEPITIATPLQLLIADTGKRSATKLPVGAVRERWQTDAAAYEALFDSIAAEVVAVRVALATGDVAALGAHFNVNQHLLSQIGVSSPEIDRLVRAANGAGALGAKLSGAGWGGVVFALVEPATMSSVATALHAAGAARVLETTVQPAP